MNRLESSEVDGEPAAQIIRAGHGNNSVIRIALIALVIKPVGDDDFLASVEDGDRLTSAHRLDVEVMIAAHDYSPAACRFNELNCSTSLARPSR